MGGCISGIELYYRLFCLGVILQGGFDGFIDLACDDISDLLKLNGLHSIECPPTVFVRV